MHNLFEGYLAHLEMNGRDASTVMNTATSLRQFDAFLVEAGVSPLDDPVLEVERFFFGLRAKYKPGTIRNRQTHIRAAYRYGIKLRKLTDDPTRTLEQILMDQHEPRTFSGDELRAIWAEVKTLYEELMFLGLCFTGMRKMEFAKLLWEQVNLAEDYLNIYGRGAKRGAVGKMGKARRVPLHPVLREVMIRAWDNRREGQQYVLESRHKRHFSNSGFDRALAALLDRAGVDGTAKMFRATFNSSLNENDAHERYVEKIMGHGASTINRKYYQRRADNKLYETILLVYKDDPILVAAPTAMPLDRLSAALRPS
jgi:integrase